MRGCGLDEDRYDRQRRLWGESGEQNLKHAKVLIAGAGGVGSEIIKNCALLGIGKLIIVDMDLIELTNLNRQLLFRKGDVGQYKAEIAAREAKSLNDEIEIQLFNEKIQNLPKEIFESADILVSALDNIPARIFLNQKAVLLNKALIDGGSEGFLGHVQVVIPRSTPCLLCHDIWSRNEEKFKCTYAVNPRTPFDCILQGRDKFILQFKRLPDMEKVEDIQIVYDYALEHAKTYNIIGVTKQLVKDSLKGTVAALVTTNSIIGGVMTNELLKILLKDVKVDDLELKPLIFYQFNGITESGWSVPLERNELCPVCSIKQIEIEVMPSALLIQFLQQLETQLTFDLQTPLLIREGVILYRDVSFLEDSPLHQPETTRIKANEIKPISELFQNGDNLFLQDENLGIEIYIIIKFKDQDKGGLA